MKQQTAVEWKEPLADGYIIFWRWKRVEHVPHPTEQGKFVWPDPVKESDWTDWTEWMRPYNAKWYADLETAKHAVEQKNRTSDYWQEEYMIVPIAFIPPDGSGMKDQLEIIITEWMKLNEKSASGLAEWIRRDILNAKNKTYNTDTP